MSGYIGSQPADSFLSISSQQITGNGGATYTLNSNVTNPEDIAIFVNNVRQNVNTYSVSNNQVTLGGTIASSDSCYVVFLGKTLATVNPPSGSVGLTQLSATGTKNNTTFLRGDNTFATPSGGTTAPYFEAYLLSNQGISSATFTKAQINTEIVDTANAYDNSTNYRFTPQTAGKYYVYGNLTMYSSNTSVNRAMIGIYKNGANYKAQNIDTGSNESTSETLHASAIIDFNGSSDYVELYGYLNVDAGNPYIQSGDKYCNFGAFKMTE